MTTKAHSEAERFLAANPDIGLIHVMLTDLNGILRGKGLRREEMATVYERGRPLPSSILSLDITGEDVTGTGLVWEVGDRDCMAHPVPGTLKRTPWLDGVGQVLLAFDEESGPVAPVDPRLRLERIAERLRTDGLHPVVAVEIEFYLLDRAAALDGRIEPARMGSNLGEGMTQVYSIQEIADAHPFLSDLYATCEAQSLPARSVISEFAPGQMEITLEHRGDALCAVDEAIQYKRAVKGVADRHDMIACFMAKPFTDRAGSGMHLHMSLVDDRGRNLFAADAPLASTLMRQAVGGLIRTLPDAMAIFAPNANSYRRFKRNSYAPIAPSWGFDNRTVSFRIPPGPAETRHVEHRVGGADANPYLAVAAALAGMHRGIVADLDPGESVVGDGYARFGEIVPPTWWSALDAFSGSDFIADYFGPSFRHVYSTVKRAECDRFHAEVQPLDHRWLLRNA